MAVQTTEDSDDDFERLSNVSFSDAASDADSMYSQDELDELNLSNDTPVTTPPSDSYRQQTPSDKEKKFKCSFENCSKAFNRPARLQEHVRSHTNDRAFKCPYQGCSNTYLRDGHLKHHIKSAHTKVRDYKCTWESCDKSFTTGTRLRNHLAVHQGHEKYRCRGFGDCNQTFRKKDTLQRHVVAVHLGAKPFPCPAEFCNKAFDTAEHLRQHQRVNHDPFRYSCTICLEVIEADLKLSDLGKQELRKSAYFSNWTDFQVHNRDVHPPTCDICNMALSSNKAVADHKEAKHNLSNPTGVVKSKFQCTLCPRKYAAASGLRVHIKRDHDGVRFECKGAVDGQPQFIPHIKGNVNIYDKGTDLDGVQGEGGNESIFVGCGGIYKTKAGLYRHLLEHHKGKEAGKSGVKAKDVKQEERAFKRLKTDSSKGKITDKAISANTGSMGDRILGFDPIYTATANPYTDADPVKGWDNTQGPTNLFSDVPDFTGDEALLNGELFGYSSGYNPSYNPDPSYNYPDPEDYGMN